MKVLQFAFDGNPENPHLPYNISSVNVVYTGTHDNDTTAGWLDTLSGVDRRRIDAYMGVDYPSDVDDIIRLAYASPAQTCIVPLQDILQLDSTHRMNIPGTPSGNWGLIRSHNMRKYFNSALLNAGADSFIVDFWMGHTLDETKSAYFRASNGLRDIYLKFVPYLTIQKEADVSESPEYLRLKQENQILQAETARHVVERSELQELRAEIEKMKPIDTELEHLLEKKMEEMVEARLNELLAKMT